MKHLITLLSCFVLLSCGTQKHLTIINDSSIDRVEEIVEVEVKDADEFAVFNTKGEQVQCQTTYKGNLIFPATVAAQGSTDYILRKEKRERIDTLATGKVYPQWFNDFAWENDKIAFRTYSTKLYESGSHFHGYDIFTKRHKLPVLDILYGATFGRETGAAIAKLRSEGKTALANQLQGSLSYHVDHGLGMDYYAVGPTLGSGTAAIFSDGKIIYPGCYSKSEILDRGGLRVSFRLTYEPIEVDGKKIQEERIITLDRGTNFNSIEVKYNNLTKPQDVVVGIVLHDDCKESLRGEGFMAYTEPMHQYGWQTYNAVICPDEISSEASYFEKPLNGAYGHLLSKNSYTPNTTFKYYMGAGWNRWGFKTPQSWYDHVKTKVEKVDKPLTYKFK